MKTLLVKAGPLQGNAYPFDGGALIIGRDADCDVQLVDRVVSRRHACVIEQDDGSVFLRDLRSHNGTFLQDARVSEAMLTVGDEFSVGASRFEYRDDMEIRAAEPELKLASGPAQETTVTSEISPDDRNEILARVAQQRAANAVTISPPCCNSPLSELARKESWKHCPACGRPVRV